MINAQNIKQGSSAHLNAVKSQEIDGDLSQVRARRGSGSLVLSKKQLRLGLMEFNHKEEKRKVNLHRDMGKHFMFMSKRVVMNMHIFILILNQLSYTGKSTKLGVQRTGLSFWLQTKVSPSHLSESWT